jgi:hypothetical protein
MQVFGFEPIAVEAGKEVEGLQEPTGSSEGLAEVKEWIVSRFRPVNASVNLTALKDKFNAAISEVAKVVKDQAVPLHEGIQLDTVSVELGVTAGGEIGFFAKGRMDIAASFSVTFKIHRAEVCKS